jgi:hypothetical protein
MRQGIAAKRRRVMTGLLLLALVVSLVAGIWRLMYCLTHPLPARSDINRVTVVTQFWAFQGGQNIPPFEIPEKHWEAILAALMPCKPDLLPAKWVWLCKLSLRTQTGQEYCVDVYWLEGDFLGAFSVCRQGRFPKRVYFRGGNSVQMRDAVVAAYEEQARLVSTQSNN